MINRNNPPLRHEAQKAFNLFEWRENFILAVLRISCLIGAVLLVVSFPTLDPTNKILYTGVYILLLVITVSKVPYSIRAGLFLTTTLAIGTDSILAWGPWNDASLFFLTSVILGALLFDARIDIYILIPTVIYIGIVTALHSLGLYELRILNEINTTLVDWLIYLLDYLLLGSIVVTATGLFKNVFTRIIRDSEIMFNTVSDERLHLEEKVAERTEELENRMTQLRNSSFTSRTIAEIRDVAELLEETTTQISEKFGYYHCGFYVLDEQKKNAFLQSSSSTNGKQLIGQAINITPDRKNILASVIEQRRSLITSDSDRKSFTADDNFPLTRSRLALPLIVRGNVIGILDLHSDQPSAFKTEDAEILQTLADLTAITFDNIRLIQESQNLVSQLESSTTLQTKETWGKLTSRQLPAYQYTPAGVRPIFNRDKRSDDSSLQVPLVLHGQSIGNIKLKRKVNNQEWSHREKLIVEKIADQVALALENSRLIDEAQKSATRDQMIASISTRIRETLDIESVARTATVELRRVFDLKEAELFIGTPNLQNQDENK